MAEEWEFGEDIAQVFEDSEGSVANLELSEAEEVENDAAVNEFNDAPPPSQSTWAKVQDFCANNQYGKVLVKFAKFVGGQAAGGILVFGIMYGINKEMAKTAKDTGKRTALSVYLAGVQANFEKNNLTWNDDIRQQAATDALAFPWIDGTR